MTTEALPFETLSSAPSPETAGVFVELSAVWPIVIGRSFAAGEAALGFDHASRVDPQAVRGIRIGAGRPRFS